MKKKAVCPCCGASGGFSVQDKVKGYTLLHCPKCDLVFSDPMKNPGGEWYNEAYVIRHSAIDDRIRDYYKWTVSSLPVRGKLLDIGCGEGIFVNYTRKKGFDSFGIDFSEHALNLGREMFGLNTVYNYSLDELKKKEGTEPFDIITFFEVLEHLDRPKDFLEEIRPLLARKGYIAASVPNRLRWPVDEFNDFPPHHLTRWSEKSLRFFLESSDFEVVKLRVGSGLGSCHSFLGYLLRILVYKAFGMYGKGMSTECARGVGILRKPITKRILSKLKPRQIRDIVLWPFALLMYPFVRRRFNGYSLMVIARAKG